MAFSFIILTGCMDETNALLKKNNELQTTQIEERRADQKATAAMLGEIKQGGDTTNQALTGEEGVLAQIKKLKTSDVHGSTTPPGPVHSTGSDPESPTPTRPYEEPFPEKGESNLESILAQLAKGEDPDLSPFQIQALLTEMEARRDYMEMLKKYGDYLRNKRDILILKAEKEKRELERDLKNIDKKPETKPKPVKTKEKPPAAYVTPPLPTPTAPPHPGGPELFPEPMPACYPVPAQWTAGVHVRSTQNLFKGFKVWRTGERFEYHEHHHHEVVPAIARGYVKPIYDPHAPGRDHRWYLNSGLNYRYR